ncbi:MAG: amidase [Chloroflexota bacterium]
MSLNSSHDLCFLPATVLAAMLRSKEISARELMEIHLAQIEATNGSVNAIVTLLPERALTAANEADARLAQGDQLGPLHGLPIAHKDLADTKGSRTTYGSPIFKDHVPEANGLIVDRLQAAGALTIGKTNTPEWGAGSQTFNPVFGATTNPYDVTKTCGGSSGGAAAALASGMIPIADGSDMGGSLRNPASFCNVVGFRNTPGVVPAYPKVAPWSPLAVQGGMGRTVGDVALMLTAIAGADPKAPLSTGFSGSTFARPLERDFKETKAAWSVDFGGLPIDSRVKAVMDAAVPVFTELGLTIKEGLPDFSGADEAFKTLRALSFAANFAPMLEKHRSSLKESVIWNAESGLALSPLEITRAYGLQGELYHRARTFMEDNQYRFMIFPVAQVPPFDVTREYVTEINGIKMETYIDWMKACYYISILGFPTISVPGGFTEEGLPVGIQIVGRYGADFEVLQLAHAFEQATGWWKRRPVAVTSKE